MVNWDMIGAIILPSIGGWIGALSMSGQVRSDDGTAWYEIIKKPSWTPPNWLFAPVWIILYSAMGYASYMIYEDCDGKSNSAALPLALYGGQLLLNWTWTPIFFKFHQMGWALTHMCVLDAVTTACIWSFFTVNKKTLLFMSPYVGWLVFATCLNYTIWQLNKDNKKVK